MDNIINFNSINSLNIRNFLIVLLSFSIIIFLYVAYKCLDESFEEYFGSVCIDFIPFSKKSFKVTKPGTIFVSVASYRDEECSMTLETMYKNAKYPDKIYAGICEQNKEGETKEACIGPETNKWRDNIKIKKFNYKDAKGPTFARYWCSTLLDGQEYFLQIDSHTTFDKDWDIKLIKMLEQVRYNNEKTDKHPLGQDGSKKPIITAYPPTKDQMNVNGFPIMSNGRLKENKIPMFLAGFYSSGAENITYPHRAQKPWAAAGFMFLDSKFINNVPFDPNLSHVFQGEEVLFSARLFTNGYDFFNPNEKICYHNYSRKESPLYWKDVPEHNECKAKAEKRVLFLLGLGPKKSVPEDFLRDYHKYGLGNFRKLNDFWNAGGVDFTKKDKEGVEDWSSNNVSKKFEGWNFNKSGYQKIKKF